MPIAPHPTKVICQDCGWHLIVTPHATDVVSSLDLKWDALFNDVPACGRCGSKNLERSEVSLSESVNPVEHARKLAYMVRRPFRSRDARPKEES